MIDFEHSDCGPANGRQAAQPSPAPLEVLFPHVVPWMKESRNLAGYRINTRDVWSLVRVAGKACPSEVLSSRRTVVFLRDDVIHLERQLSAVNRESTVFALPASPLYDQSFEELIRTPHVKQLSRTDVRGTS